MIKEFVKQNKENNFQYEQLIKYFQNDVNNKKGFYKSKSKDEIKNEIQKRDMWNSYKKSLEKILNLDPEVSSVIDAGCGMGQFSIELSKYKNFETIIGVDILRESLCLSFEKPEIFKNVNFIQGNLLEMPFKDRNFDVCFCINVLHHIHNYDLEKAIKELARITDKYLILEIRYKKNIFEIWYTYLMLPNFYKKLPIYSHTITQMKNILKKFNFEYFGFIGKYETYFVNRRLLLLYRRSNL